MSFSDGHLSEPTGTEPFPDLMNDSAYDSASKGKGRDLEDPDTCRICHGEGTDEEELFYPCKCSGSIKFVHQACLVEWLSHSQKKHCELCKTPFRFTKLYDPNMPDSLPAPLFMKHLLFRGLRTVVTWLRFALVAFVWLGWLPWSMRAIWRALFWLADGHWSGGDNSQQTSSESGIFQSISNLTAAATSALPAAHSVASTADTADSQSFQAPVSSMFSFSTAEPLLVTLAKRAFWTLFFPAMSSTGTTTASANSSTISGLTKQRRPSWLSDVKFLNSLTPSPTINNILIDTLEGQLITLLVVISFILIFLIREWVVQQQPMANIAEGEREAAVQLIANDRPNLDHQDIRQEPEAAHPGNRDHDMVHWDPPSDQEDDGPPHSPGGMDLDERPPFDRDETSSDWDDSVEERPADTPLSTHSDRGDHVAAPDSSLQSADHLNQSSAGSDPFKDLWIRAQGDPEQVLRIIEEDGLQEELGWVVIAMRKLLRTNATHESSSRDRAPSDTSLSSPVPRPEQTPRDNDEPSFGENPQPAPVNRDWDFTTSSSSHPNANINTENPGNNFNFAFNFLEPPSDEPRHEETAPSHPIPTNNDLVDSNARSTGATDLDVRPNVDGGSTDAGNPQSRSDNPAAPPRNLGARMFDWFWGDITPGDQDEGRAHQDDEHVVEDPALEEPFVPVHNNRALPNGDAQDNQGIAADFGLDANDLEAIDDADDLEGLLELIGMQGPIFGLLQNGVFSALLISFTVALGIWLPYLWGKIALVLLANPVQLVFGVPMTAVSIFADVALDTLIGSLGYLMYWVTAIFKLLLNPFGAFLPLGNTLEGWVPQAKSVTSASLSLIDASSHRLRNVAKALFVFHESDVPMFSVLSHQALKVHQARIATLVYSIYACAKFVIYDLPLRILLSRAPDAPSFHDHVAYLGGVLAHARDQIYRLGHFLLYSNGTKWFTANAADISPLNLTVDYDLAVWDTKDRIIAIIMGYVLASALALLYVRITDLFSNSDRTQRTDGVVSEILHQSGGVMKVILIIGIEMIVFPLYCGSLLDVALLPLFENATIASRLQFTTTAPMTSLFVHWFIGTCYMFHFALFVSMCRKIMRSGVLYFIRDPDDPTFHPVRDVLERNITTQLRKIAFSALVYGALVIVCLGGVVWGLYYAFDNVLPIHRTSTIPVFEFPFDLLFYHFVMPLAIPSIKPSDGLHDLYNWWFHKCARFLRLSDFFFGERQLDEEGHHIRRTWWDALRMAKGDIRTPVVGEEQQRIADEKNTSAYFLRDGKYVRAPASDQVRIPKGSKVFLEVTDSNERVDGAPDPDGGLHGRTSDMFTKVFIPPHFRTRIAVFILLIWVFAAATGVGITVVPMIIGRKIMSSYLPNRRLNDIYAFSIGICLVGGAGYVALYCKTYFQVAKDYLRPYLHSPRQAFAGLAKAAADACRLVYIFAAFSLFMPSVLGFVMELYVLMPVHTYLAGAQSHVIYVLQDWLLGVVYLQMAIKLVQWHSTSRPAVALNNIFRNGWLKPDVNLATRAVLLPVVVFAAAAVALPLALGFTLNSTLFYAAPGVQAEVYRYAYPLTLSMALTTWLAHLVRRQVESWRVNIRDDVYLIGERLHNFGEKRARGVGVPRQVMTEKS